MVETAEPLHVVKTKYLFLILLYYLRPSLVLDIGSLDGADSLRFRKMLPDATIFAFEANPYLCKAMIDDPRLAAARINIVNCIVSPKKGVARFYISKDSASGQSSGNRGTSSLLRRSGDPDVAEVIELPTCAIDQYLGDAGSAALWIDVEGAGYEVLSTAETVAEKVAVIHIEGELKPKWQNQKLKPDIANLAARLGFAFVAHSRNAEQQDMVFVNNGILKTRPELVRRALFLTRLHGPFFARYLTMMPEIWASS